MTLTVADIDKLTRPMRRRITHLVSRAKLTMVDDGQGLQRNQLQVLDGETRDNVEVFEQYGLSVHPEEGAEALMLSLGGSRDHPVIVAVSDRRSRPRSRKRGEVELYNSKGVSILLQADGTILIKAPGNKVRVETDRLEVTGDIIDRCDGEGRSMQSMREVYNGHHHPQTSQPVEKM